MLGRKVRRHDQGDVRVHAGTCSIPTKLFCDSGEGSVNLRHTKHTRGCRVTPVGNKFFLLPLTMGGTLGCKERADFELKEKLRGLERDDKRDETEVSGSCSV